MRRSYEGRIYALRNLGKEIFRLRRETILYTAAECFNRKNYHGATMEDIARELKVTKPTLYKITVPRIQEQD